MASYFAYRLIPPRPSFADDMSEAEAAIMGDHVAYWHAYLDRGTAVVFGPVADPAGLWGLAVVEADGEEDVQALAAGDPAIRSGMASFEVHAMPGAMVRG